MPTIRRTFRPLLLLSLFLAAAAAPALTLNLVSNGPTIDFQDFGGGDYLFGTEEKNFTTQTSSPAVAPFNDLSITAYSFGGTFDGLMAYQDASQNHVLNLEVALTSDTTTAGVRTFKGTWSYVSGVGDYADFSTAISGGAWSFDYNAGRDFGAFSLTGDLLNHSNPAPEPAPLAALGLGALALLRRKKRA